MKQLLIILIIIGSCSGCTDKKDYQKAIHGLNALIKLHENLSIGNRGELKVIAFKLHNKTVFKDMALDANSNTYKFKDSLRLEEIKTLNYAFSNDSIVSSSIKDLTILAETRINFIIKACLDLNIVASNCLDEEKECVDCVFWYNLEERLFYFSDTTCKQQFKDKVHKDLGNWLYIYK